MLMCIKKEKVRRGGLNFIIVNQGVEIKKGMKVEIPGGKLTIIMNNCSGQDTKDHVI